MPVFKKIELFSFFSKNKYKGQTQSKKVTIFISLYISTCSWFNYSIRHIKGVYDQSASRFKYQLVHFRVIIQIVMGWLERVVNQIYVKLFLILDLFSMIRFTGTLYFSLHLSFPVASLLFFFFWILYTFLCSCSRPYAWVYRATIKKFRSYCSKF